MATKQPTRAGNRKRNDDDFTLQRYLRESSTGSASILLTAPVVLLYEIGLIATGARTRNAAHVLVNDLLTQLGRPGTLILNVTVLIAILVAAFVPRRRLASPVGLIVPVVLESTIYACILAPLVLLMSGRSLSIGGLPTDPRIEATVLSLGAGFYEEVLFRLAGVAGLYLPLRRVLHLSQFWAVSIPLFLSSFLFALFHHVGLASEPFVARVFAFRFLAGVLLGGLFVIRGFGVACYTHVIYDLLCVWAA